MCDMWCLWNKVTHTIQLFVTKHTHIENCTCMYCDVYALILLMWLCICMSSIQEKDWCAYWRPHQCVDSLNFSLQVQQDPSVGPSMDVKRNCALTAPFHDLRGIPCCLFVAFLVVASLRHFLVATRQGMLCTLDGATGSLLQLSCKEYWLWNILGHWNTTHWTYPPNINMSPEKGPFQIIKTK